MNAHVQIARSSGSGCARFLARALIDPLSGGSHLAAVIPLPGNRGGWTVDFVFPYGSGTGSEIIRGVINPSGQLVSAEIWIHDEPPPSHVYEYSEALMMALSSHAIAEVRVVGGQVVITDDRGENLVIQADKFHAAL